MSESVHPESAVLIRFLDGELDGRDLSDVHAHLQSCAQCRDKQGAYARLSGELDLALKAVPMASNREQRARLVRAMSANRPHSPAGRALWRFGLGMAIAATLALALLFAPGSKVSVTGRSIPVARREVSSLSVNGEMFVALPYSNPDLPVNTSRIVEMQVPVSALAEAGIALEPGASDRVVPANVLLGIDGQPLGIHVLGTAE